MSVYAEVTRKVSSPLFGLKVDRVVEVDVVEHVQHFSHQLEVHISPDRESLLRRMSQREKSGPFRLMSGVLQSKR